MKFLTRKMRLFLTVYGVFGCSLVLGDDVSIGTRAPEEIIRQCVENSRKMGYPVDLLEQRWEEGLAKGIAPQSIAQAVQAREKRIEQAADMLRAANYTLKAPPVRELQGSVALAMESGLPEDVLVAVLGKGGGAFVGRMQGAVEAGEALFLAGLERETVQVLMEDFITRSLRRAEVIRAVQYVIQQHRDGLSSPEIRSSLWSSLDKWSGFGGRRGGRLGPGGEQRGTRCLSNGLETNSP